MRYLPPNTPVVVLGRPTKLVAYLLGGLVALFFVNVFTGAQAYSSMSGLSWHALAKGQVWRIVTSLVWFGTPDSVETLQFLGAALCLWGMGSPLEQWWGPARLGLAFTLAGMLGNLAAMAVSASTCSDAPVGGPGAAAVGLVTAGSIVFSRSLFLVPKLSATSGLLGRHLGYGTALVLGLSALVDLFGGRCAARYAGYGAAALIATALVTGAWRPGRILMVLRRRRAGRDSKIVPFRKDDRVRWN